MATQASLNYVQSLYVAYYGRPADSGGLQYWAERADAEGQGAIINAFGTSQEFTDQYGDLGNEELVNSLYQQLFNRDAEQEGLDYYTGVLESGEKTLAEITVTIMNAAQGPDQTAIDNKIEVAQAYTDAMGGEDYNYSFAQNLVSGIDGQTTQEELDAAKAQAAGSAVPDFSEDQVLEVSGSADMDTYFNAAELEDYEALRLADVDSSTVAGSDSGAITVEGLAADKWVLVENSTMTLNLNETESGHVVLSDSEVLLWGDTDDQGGFTETLSSLTVATEGESSLELGGSAAAGLESLTLIGSGNLTLTGNPLPTDATVDASGMTGSLTITNADGELLESASSVTAGSGDDAITVSDISDSDGTSALSIDGGAGDDTLTVTSDLQPDNDSTAEVVDANVSNVETVTFESYSRVDAEDFTGTETFVFNGGGEIQNLVDGQVEVEGLSTQDSGPIIRESSGDLEVTNNVGASLDLGVFDSIGAEGDTLTLSGDSAISYEESGRDFATIDASGLEGGLEFTSAGYVAQGVILGNAADTIYAVDEDTDSTDEVTTSPTSTYGNMDTIQNFEDGTDELVDSEGNAIDVTSSSADVSAAGDLEAAFSAVADDVSGDEYVSFDFDGSTYIYANTESAADDTANLSDGDFAIEFGTVATPAESTDTSTTTDGADVVGTPTTSQEPDILLT